MQVVVNGFVETCRAGTRISDIIDRFEERDHALIVEVNGRFVYPENYSLELRDGDRIELIHPAFGG